MFDYSRRFFFILFSRFALARKREENLNYKKTQLPRSFSLLNLLCAHRIRERQRGKDGQVFGHSCLRDKEYSVR